MYTLPGIYLSRYDRSAVIGKENKMKKRDSFSQVKLSEAQKEKLKDELKTFYLTERGEEIGMIEQMQLLHLFEEKLAPVVYKIGRASCRERV